MRATGKSRSCIGVSLSALHGSRIERIVKGLPHVCRFVFACENSLRQRLEQIAHELKFLDVDHLSTLNQLRLSANLHQPFTQLRVKRQLEPLNDQLSEYISFQVGLNLECLLEEVSNDGHVDHRKLAVIDTLFAELLDQRNHSLEVGPVRLTLAVDESGEHVRLNSHSLVHVGFGANCGPGVFGRVVGEIVVVAFEKDAVLFGLTGSSTACSRQLVQRI